MPAPRLNLVAENTGRAFRAVCNRLKAHPALKNLGITWRVWDGSAIDTAEITAAHLPFVEIRSPDGAAVFADERQHRVDMGLELTVMVPGTKAEALFDLWQEMSKALYPPGDWGDEADIVGLTWEQIPGGWSLIPGIPASLQASARLKLILFVTTPGS
jgi:hypothetical protein